MLNQGFRRANIHDLNLTTGVLLSPIWHHSKGTKKFQTWFNKCLALSKKFVVARESMDRKKTNQQIPKQQQKKAKVFQKVESCGQSDHDGGMPASCSRITDIPQSYALSPAFLCLYTPSLVESNHFTVWSGTCFSSPHPISLLNVLSFSWMGKFGHEITTPFICFPRICIGK